jgi:3-ketoacyl-CoA synthase
MAKIIERSGINPEGTYSPNAINPGCPLDPAGPVNDIPAAMVEAEMVMCGAVGDVLEKTGTRPEDVDILVTMCSIFCPTPSLASMIVSVLIVCGARKKKGGGGAPRADAAAQETKACP